MDRNRDGSINDLPWASVFDPAANARSLSAIQAEGFRAASQLVDRFARLATSGPNGENRSATSAAPPSDAQRADVFGATDIEPLVRSWWAWVGQMMLGFAPAAPTAAAAEPTALDLSGATANGAAALEITTPGEAATEVWLHNRTATDVGEIRLRCSDLTSDMGFVVESAAVRFDPVTAAMPPRSSRGIELSIELADDVAAGVYRGTVLTEGRPDLWLPVVLTVRAPAS